MVKAQPANRLANKRARKIATGMPREYPNPSNQRPKASIMRAMITQGGIHTWIHYTRK